MDSLMAKERLGTESDQDFGDDCERQKTKDGNEDDIKQVTGTFMQAVAASSQKQPVHRCTSFFDFMAESAKELTPFKQDRLMDACHMALHCLKLKKFERE
ncbi:hypothetical protein MTO96_032948 [Rhipicephalus appendiculatus]